MSDDLQHQVSGIAALADPARLSLYMFVVASADPVSREQAANGVGVAVHSAKFHLDRLVDEGLLEVEFRRLSGRTGPGAGRPSKLYRRSSRELSVTLPERRYDVAGHVLAEAIERSVNGKMTLEEAVRQAADAEGRRIATEPVHPVEADGDERPVVDTGAGAADEADEITRTAEALARHGYEPRTCADEICLANCPFDSLAQEHTALVCGMNLALIEGLVDELGCDGLEPVLDPQPGLCCVKVARRS